MWSLLRYVLLSFIFLFSFCEKLHAQHYFDHLTITEGLTHNTVHCITQDTNGYIWIGTSYGLNRYNGYDLKVFNSAFSSNSSKGFQGLDISAIFEDSAGNLWVGTKKMGVNIKYFESDTFINCSGQQAFDPIKGVEISSFYEDKKGNIWITTVGAGVIQYDPIQETSVVYNSSNAGLSSDITFSVVEDTNGIVWVASAGGGINMKLKESEEFQLSHEMLPNSANLSGYRKKLCLDGEFLWLATQGTGVYRVNLNNLEYERFSLDNVSKGLTSNVVMDIIKDKDDNIFAATDGDGLFRFDRTDNVFISIKNKHKDKASLNSSALQCLYMDVKDNLWIGTFNGGVNILKTTKVKFDFYSLGNASDESPSSNSVLSFRELSNGQLLVGTDGGGLYLYDNPINMSRVGSFKYRKEEKSSISGNIVRSIYEDSSGRVWIGHFGSGVDLFDPKKRIFTRVFDSGVLSNANVWAITERSDGLILIGTLGEGLFLYDPVSLDLREIPLRSKEIMDVFVDSDFNVWVAYSEKGIDVLNQKGDLINTYELDLNDNLSLSDNGVRTIYQDKDGRIWIGTERGGVNLKVDEGFKSFDQSDGFLSNNITAICQDTLGDLWFSGYSGVTRFDYPLNETANYDFRKEKDANQFNQKSILECSNGSILIGGIYGMNLIDPAKPDFENQDCNVFISDLKINNQLVHLNSSNSDFKHISKPIEHADQIRMTHKDYSFTIYLANNDFANKFDAVFDFKMDGFDPNWKQTAKGINSVTYTNLDPGTYVFNYKYRDIYNSVRIDIAPPFWQKLWFRFLSICLILIGLWSAINLYTQRQVASHKRQLLQLEKEQLESEIDQNNSKLMFNSAQIAQKNEVLKSLLKEIKKLNSTKDLMSLESKINFELINSDYWNEFNYYFSQIDKSFVTEIKIAHPSLTKNDLRIIALLRLNLSTKEIAALLNVSVRGVEQARYRLKKRLGLDVNTDLGVYVLNLK